MTYVLLTLYFKFFLFLLSCYEPPGNSNLNHKSYVPQNLCWGSCFSFSPVVRQFPWLHIAVFPVRTFYCFHCLSMSSICQTWEKGIALFKSQWIRKVYQNQISRICFVRKKKRFIIKSFWMFVFFINLLICKYGLLISCQEFYLYGSILYPLKDPLRLFEILLGVLYSV